MDTAIIKKYVEIGVRGGNTLSRVLNKYNTIEIAYAIDPYASYLDWCGFVNQEELNLAKKEAYKKINDMGMISKVNFIEKKSKDVAHLFEDESIDLLYIDGDHSLEGALCDFLLYYSKVKKDFYFGGHDYSLEGVNSALKIFCEIKNLSFDNDIIKSDFPYHNSWYITKK